MKKLLCLLLALALMPAAVWAEDLSIPELMARQVSANSTLRFLITVEAEGDTPYFMPDAAWQTLKTIAPGAEIEGSYILSKAGDTLGNAQLSIELRQGGAAKGSLFLHGREDAFVVSGDMLSEALLLPRETDILLRDKTIPLSAWLSAIARDVGLLNISADQAGQWPTLRAFITRAATETEDWKISVDNALAPYLDDLSSWLQSRAQLFIEKRADGTMGTVSRVSASIGDCAAEIAVLLERFYSDDTLRGLLRQAMTQLEAQAYLEEGMLPLFKEMLAALPGTGDMQLERRYDSAGSMTDFTLTLPFADGSKAQLLWQNGAYSLALHTGNLTLSLSLDGSGEGAYLGAFSLKQGEKTYSGSYQLFVSLGDVVVNAANVGRERTQEGMITLLITPGENMPFPAQSLSLSLNASAGASDTKAARWNAVLAWSDLEGASTLTATLKTRTAAVIAQSEAPGAERAWDDMAADERAAWLQALLDGVVAALSVR